MVVGDGFAASAVAAASRKTAMIGFIFITLSFPYIPTLKSALTYITGSSGATVGFTRRLAVRAEVLVGLRAPVSVAGKFVVRVPLVVHFLAAQIAAGNLEVGRRGSGLHNFNERRD